MPQTATAAGTTIGISAGVPATQDQTGYAALTYTTIGNVQKLGTIGATPAKTEFQPLNGPKQKIKGSIDYGSLAPSLAIDSTDAGQTLMSTAANNQIAWYAFKVVYPSAAIRYFQGAVFGMPEEVGGADDIIMANPTIEINTIVVKA